MHFTKIAKRFYYRRKVLCNFQKKRKRKSGQILFPDKNLLSTGNFSANLSFSVFTLIHKCNTGAVLLIRRCANIIGDTVQV